MHLSYSLLFPVAAQAFRAPKLFSQQERPWFSSDIKVPVQLGVMSRCPDALLCEGIFDKVSEKISEKMDLSLVYIANLNSSDPIFGVTCMHGQEECWGNIQQLCVAKHEPSAWWEFVQCQNYNGREKIGTPELASNCAKAVGFEWESSAAARCAGSEERGKSDEGTTLLQESVKLGKKLGVKFSCTILIDSRPVCVHDSTWKKCENGHTVNDFVKQISDEYDKLNGD